MNVLILTPDAVGSTLLQRLITIYMQFHDFDRPVINIHEITNGIQKYYSPDFNRELLGKKRGSWGYYQSLEEITKLLHDVDHYKIARLAQYHILNRGDILAHQVPFYNYLNRNFFIISCRRRNVFENAVSWCINNITKKLNVYSTDEKVFSFIDLYQKGIEIDPESMYQALERYRNYITWCDQFHIARYFYYEDHLGGIEKFILDLPIFSAQTQRIGWNEAYGIDFSDYNRCTFYSSDIGSLALESSSNVQRLLTHHQQQTPENKNIENSLVSLLSNDKAEFLAHNRAGYLQSNQSINRMMQLGILPGPLPIKKQTLAEKKYMVRNWNDCVEIYNRWIVHYPHLGSVLSSQGLETAITNDKKYWKPNQESTLAVTYQQQTQQC